MSQLPRLEGFGIFLYAIFFEPHLLEKNVFAYLSFFSLARFKIETLLGTKRTKSWTLIACAYFYIFLIIKIYA